MAAELFNNRENALLYLQDRMATKDDLNRLETRLSKTVEDLIGRSEKSFEERLNRMESSLKSSMKAEFIVLANDYGLPELKVQFKLMLWTLSIIAVAVSGNFISTIFTKFFS